MRVIIVTEITLADSAMTFDFDVASLFVRTTTSRGCWTVRGRQLAVLAAGHDRRAL